MNVALVRNFTVGCASAFLRMSAFWVNEFAKTRVFATTLGHANDTMQSPVYLDLVTRGLLWSCGKLDAAGKPLPGYAAKK